MRRVVPTPAGVFDGRPTSSIDMSVRNTWELALDDDSAEAVSRRLDALRPELAAHFATPLSGHEGPTFLMYQPGGFYEPHTDRSEPDDMQIRPVHRRISAVVFLNDDYVGGALTFYGLIDGPQWKSIGFGLQPEPGLLVAFPSDVIHEVTPVTSGDRYTIVDWYTA